MIEISRMFDNRNNIVDQMIFIGFLSLMTCGLEAITARSGNLMEKYLVSDTEMLFANKVLDVDYKVFSTVNPSKLISLNGFGKELSYAIWNLVGFIECVTTIAIFTSTIYQIDKVIAIVTFVAYSLATPVINRVFKKLDALLDNVREIQYSLAKEMTDVIEGFSEVRTFNTQESHRESLRSKQANLVDWKVKRSNVGALATILMNVTMYVPTIIAVYISCSHIDEGLITAAQAVTVIMYIWKFARPSRVILDCVADFQENVNHLDDFMNVINHENDPDGYMELDTFDSTLSFENVSFSYDNTNSVLSDVNFTIHKGQKIGICGTSGGGKSTLLKLIPRFYRATSGSIKLDGIDINDLTANSLRSHISIVHQDNVLLDDSIRNNITYGISNVTEYQIVEACKKASIYNFITSLPEGFDTNVGPRGLKLSGGQKQRLALARVFLSNSDIILLDEATSALDNESESIVQESMELLEGKTLIIVAHRLSTIQNCDKIVVIDNHTIAESGTHKELLEKNGIYRKLQKV